MKKILMTSIHSWESPFQVSSHYIARYFAKCGWRVAYLSAPITPFHLLRPKSNNFKVRLSTFFSGGRKYLNEKLWAYVPFSLIAPDNRPFLRKKFVLDYWCRTSFLNIEKILKRKGFYQPDIFYLDNPYHGCLFKSCKPRYSVYHMVDDYLAFPGASSALRDCERNLVQKTDLVVYPSSSLERDVNSLMPKKKLFLSNGVDLSRFSDVGQKPVEYSNSGLKAVYVGALGSWFDNEMLLTSARNNSDISFYLIGPKPEKQVLGSNIYYLGEKKAEEVPSYLQYADVGIIPFDTKCYASLISPVRPLKLFEYFASGLPVVSSSWKELERLASPALLCDTINEFSDAIPKAIANKKLLGVAGMKFVKKYSWDSLLTSLYEMTVG